MPSGSGCCGTFTDDMDGAYVQLLISPSRPSTGCNPFNSALVMLALDQVNREVDSVVPPSEKV